MSKEMEEFIVQSYQKEENMMILVFAQWCINHDLDPEAVYLKAYPEQSRNQALKDALALTVPNETLLGVLSLFGNDDFALIVREEIARRDGQKKL
ncbi:hypothetical protein RRU94_15675 [Domibacillus sp. DTU_2020_1001157_1_SI_ALB_TIR_016]|uniref:hypothetical protein n=1 Tax=Domibacillus sp. DTU_2020_1001157_1_SI_ALB_TIR_016 TaxID=3077789 RepID=UPI0028E24658|nr:hypothetical protein [Domibacillus sp. DTU_2020_1001157_1_SI_ALB_TIR_016]WNS82187.1 hypothetical protein RRU94_15675 [Domibacillus sp. DTU_2020_1001157_1_SI_ALB_TIR_016]